MPVQLVSPAIPVSRPLGEVAEGGAPALTCRLCGERLEHEVVDLGMSPLCESYVRLERRHEMEPFYPLCVFVCGACFLVQLPAHVAGRDIFTEYAYFSSYSDSWLAHAERFAATMTRRLGLGATSQVVEVGSNDGYLLQYFLRHGIPVLGIDPAANVARAAVARGVPTEVRFFGRAAAEEIAGRGRRADLLVANNVLAQVPDLHDFIAGLALMLAPGGTLTLEFPHLMRLVEGNQFDTIYHEHYSYFSLATVRRALAGHGLEVFDVEELRSHGGSLRVFARQAGHGESPPDPRVDALLRTEAEAEVASLPYSAAFAGRTREVKRQLLRFLIEARDEGKRVLGYGAPGKGNTLLNYCGIGTDLLEFTVDRNPVKQGKLLPGSRIPVLAPDAIERARPDYVLILPWNIREEIVAYMEGIREWGGRFVVAMPGLTVF